MVLEGQTVWELTDRLLAADRRGDEIVCQEVQVRCEAWKKECSDHNMQAPRWASGEGLCESTFQVTCTGQIRAC